MSLTVTEEAIAAENTLRSRVNELHKDLLTAAKNLITTYGENQTGLGAHSGKIQTLLQEIVDEGGQDDDVKKLVRRLKMDAMNRRFHLDNGGVYQGRSR